MTLSDGTKVWLNSETEMKYPVVFDRGKREVFITGEAFFEVVKDSAVLLLCIPLIHIPLYWVLLLT